MNIIPEWMTNHFSTFLDFIRMVVVAAGQDATASYFENAKKALDFFLELSAVFVALFGISYIRDIKRKQKESTFSFLSKLGVRLEYLVAVLNQDEVVFIDALSQNPKGGTEDDSLTQHKLCDLEGWCENTLHFLRDEENQYPAAKGWSSRIYDLVDFLSICKNISNKDYYYWNDEIKEEEKRLYYTRHKNNIKELSKMISSRQRNAENVFFPINRRK